MTPSQALTILSRQGHLKPLNKPPSSPPYGPNHDPNKQCAYHQHSGHETDNCIHLRHDIQDLIDSRTIKPPQPDSQTKPPNTEPPRNVNLINLSHNPTYNPSQYIVQNNQAKPTLTFPEEDECFMMEEEEDAEPDQSEVIDPDMSDEEEQAKEEKLRKWKEHSWAKHNLEDPDIPSVEDDAWLHIWFENKKKEKERVIMMRRHARFEPAQIVVPINSPKIPAPPIVWETINLIKKVEEFQMQPWINPYDECDYSQWIEEREDLDFICPDPYKAGDNDFDEMEVECDDPLDGISLAPLFNSVEIEALSHPRFST
ncbi:hypothetical protein RHMOL_Rhmol04G0223600 [Rhododendron molle]|uniref:Uncharacterized protein n=2 Tax=Rhododendron molle TaxID=49168 RepID=A0ACC0P3B7_RHOML|nr:hypothetical protein RHMOL_Rhmol04G0223600 [Rhododendron molle]